MFSVLRTLSPARPRLGRDASELAFALLLVAPVVALVTVFKWVPLLTGATVSLRKSVGTEREAFVGLGNYERMFTDDAWLAALVNSLKGLSLLPLFVLVPLLLAFILYRGIFGWRFFRSLMFLTSLLPPVMVGIMLNVILAGDGPLNALLQAIGLGAFAIPWLGTSGSAIWTVYAIIGWASVGLGVVIFMAAFGTISEELFDAAKIDGASFFQTFFHVAMPMVRGTVAFYGILIGAALLLATFPWVYSLTGGGPGYASMVPDFYIYRIFGRAVDPGYASALGIILLGLTLAVVLVQYRFIYLRSQEG